MKSKIKSQIGYSKSGYAVAFTFAATDNIVDFFLIKYDETKRSTILNYALQINFDEKTQLFDTEAKAQKIVNYYKKNAHKMKVVIDSKLVSSSERFYPVLAKGIEVRQITNTLKCDL